MASPLRHPARPARTDRDAEFELLDSLGAPAPVTGRTSRLRVAGAPELVTDDDHPDFHTLRRYRAR